VAQSLLAQKGVTSKRVSGMSQGRLAGALAAYLIEYDVERAAEWVRVRGCFEKVFEREAMTGGLLYGDDRMPGDVFQSIVQNGLEELDGMCRTGYKILLGRFCRECEIETMVR
jgi:hypothetical protein